MKTIWIVSIVILLLSGCQPKQDVSANTLAIENAVHSFFIAISKYDYQGLRDQCTPDFILIEQGQWWNTDSLTNVMKGLEGKATISYSMDNITSKVEGSVGWVVYKNHGTMTMGNKQTRLDWTESAILRNDGGAWKMLLLHSSRTSPL